MTVSRSNKAKGGSPAPFQRRPVPSSGEGSGDLHRIDVAKSSELEGKGLGLTPDPHPWLTDDITLILQAVCSISNILPDVLGRST